MSKCKGYIIEEPISGLQLYAVTDNQPVWNNEGWVYPSFIFVRGLLDFLADMGYKCICRKLEGVEE